MDRGEAPKGGFKLVLPQGVRFGRDGCLQRVCLMSRASSLGCPWLGAFHVEALKWEASK